MLKLFKPEPLHQTCFFLSVTRKGKLKGFLKQTKKKQLCLRIQNKQRLKKKKQESLSEQHNHGKTKKRQAQSSKHRKKNFSPLFKSCQNGNCATRGSLVSAPSFSVVKNRKLTFCLFVFEKEPAKSFLVD